MRSVSQLPGVSVYRVSPTQQSRLSWPPASLWEMYASGAGSGWLVAEWAGKMAHWQLVMRHVSKLYTLHAYCTGRKSRARSLAGWDGKFGTCCVFQG